MGMLILILAICVIVCLYKAVSYTIRVFSNYPKLKEKIKELEDVIKSKNNDIRLKSYEINSLNQQVKDLKAIMGNKEPFSIVSSLMADALTLVYDNEAKYMRNKTRPAFTSAQIVSQLKEKTRKYIEDYKNMQYRYEFMLSSFPEIKQYIENDTELLNIAEYVSYSDLQDNRDRSRDYLSDDEWKKLTVTQRNQLALDRYVQKRKKSNWAIGRDYEMACAYSLRKKGYSVEMHGIEKRLGDLGRDLIAMRFDKTLFETNYSSGEILVIQCKCWNRDFPVRENVLMQLYGTTVAYQIENKKILGTGIKVVPVLMIPSFTKLSEMAVCFAEVLGIRISRQEFIEFPRIKCNINVNSKIYHLPFDQQYDTAQIKNPGEFYAFTVAEAESKGFRRAMRHIHT